MTNLFLIHNDNSFSEIESITDDLKFGLDNPLNSNTVIDTNIDAYISQKFIPTIQDKEIDILFIKDSLSQNYLDFLGLRLAYHIRLSEELGDKRFIPIVILSDLDGYNLNQFTTLARILFTKNIFIGDNNPSTIGFYKNNLTTNEDLKNNFKEEFLNVVEIEAPKDYLSSHSIANEWSIYRWGKYLGIENEDIEKNISSMLYFKYLKNKYPINNTDDFIPNTPIETGKVLYIDDEWKKGWKNIFESLFSSLEFECIEEEYKDKEAIEIIDFVREKINYYTPDTVILDLRLHDDDFKEDVNIDDLTGIKILKIIKEEINRGIQCIALTASQNSLILEKLYEYDIVGYVKKEHPHNYKLDTKENINKIVTLVDEGLKNKYLKDIWIIQEKIKNLNNFTITREDDLLSELFTNSQFVFDILNGKAENKMNMAILTIYKCFEVIATIYIENKKFKNSPDYLKNYTPQDNSQDNPLNTVSIGQIKTSTMNKIHNIMISNLSLNDKVIHEKLCELNFCRNNIVHPITNQQTLTTNQIEKDGIVLCSFIANPTNENIVEWFQLLHKIIEAMKDRHT